MLGIYQVTRMTKLPDIWPLSLDRWVDDDLDGHFHHTHQLPFLDTAHELYHSLQDPANRPFTDSLSAIPTHYPYPCNFNTAEYYVILALLEEFNSIALPVFTEEELQLIPIQNLQKCSGNYISQLTSTSYLASTKTCS